MCGRGTAVDSAPALSAPIASQTFTVARPRVLAIRCNFVLNFGRVGDISDGLCFALECHKIRSSASTCQPLPAAFPGAADLQFSQLFTSELGSGEIRRDTGILLELLAVPINPQ
jgi:hypothetical protein